MRTREITAGRLRTWDRLVEHPEGGRRVALKVCSVIQDADSISVGVVRADERIETRSFKASDRVKVLA